MSTLVAIQSQVGWGDSLQELKDGLKEKGVILPRGNFGSTDALVKVLLTNSHQKSWRNNVEILRSLMAELGIDEQPELLSALTRELGLDVIQRGDLSLVVEDYGIAGKCYSKAIEREPDSLQDPDNKIGKKIIHTYFQDGNISGLELLIEKMHVGMDKLIAMRNLALLYGRNQQPDTAQDVYKGALSIIESFDTSTLDERALEELQGLQISIMLNLANLLSRDKKDTLTEAKSVYENAISLSAVCTLPGCDYMRRYAEYKLAFILRRQEEYDQSQVLLKLLMDNLLSTDSVENNQLGLKIHALYSFLNLVEEEENDNNYTIVKFHKAAYPLAIATGKREEYFEYYSRLNQYLLTRPKKLKIAFIGSQEDFDELEEGIKTGFKAFYKENFKELVTKLYTLL